MRSNNIKALNIKTDQPLYSFFMEADDLRIDPNKNTIICGDNFTWLDYIPNESIDMCYIDPPFFSNKDYNYIWYPKGDEDNPEIRSFKDIWSGGIEHYIHWMRPRIRKISMKLKKTGSIFLHCDWHASHRLRCLLDDIFGSSNFKNEIIWSYQRWTNKSNCFQRTHDVILFYAKDEKEHFFVPQTESYSEKSKHKSKRFSKLDNGKLIQCYTEDTDRKKSMRDVWDISVLNSQAKERIGYPTQKPEELLERIIKCSTKEGDVVLDCFCGGGTTAKVCCDLDRKFIVGDITPVACRVTENRIKSQCNNVQYELKNYPSTVEMFKKIDGHKFEELICDIMDWTLNPKRHTGDGTIDAWDKDGTPIQIKNGTTKGSKVDPEMIKAFESTIRYNKKKKGIYVAWGYSPKAWGLINDFRRDGIEIEVLKCEEILSKFALIVSETEDRKNTQAYKRFISKIDGATELESAS